VKKNLPLDVSLVDQRVIFFFHHSVEFPAKSFALERLSRDRSQGGLRGRMQSPTLACGLAAPLGEVEGDRNK
jgi:hypothetical protein